MPKDEKTTNSQKGNKMKQHLLIYKSTNYKNVGCRVQEQLYRSYIMITVLLTTFELDKCLEYLI